MTTSEEIVLWVCAAGPALVLGAKWMYGHEYRRWVYGIIACTIISAIAAPSEPAVFAAVVLPFWVAYSVGFICWFRLRTGKGAGKGVRNR